MANIFSKTPKVTGSSFSVDAATFTFAGLTSTTQIGGGRGIGLLIQNVQLQYQQQLNFIYDLSNPQAVYYVAGRAEGTLQIGKVVGDTSSMQTFFQVYGNVCAVRQPATITGVTGCASVGPSGLPSATPNTANAFTINDPVMNSYGLSMTVNEGIVSEQIQMRFTDMSLGGGAARDPAEAVQ
jgi:hypothetical protein